MMQSKVQHLNVPRHSKLCRINGAQCDCGADRKIEALFGAINSLIDHIETHKVNEGTLEFLRMVKEAFR